MPTTLDDLPVKMRHLRQFCGLSQDTVAQEMGISQAAYSKLERGKTRLTLLHLQTFANLLDINLADFLNCPVDDLLTINIRKKPIFQKSGKE
jgi:transcriptional regulator with XRE-family HTH domain